MLRLIFSYLIIFLVAKVRKILMMVVLQHHIHEELKVLELLIHTGCHLPALHCTPSYVIYLDNNAPMANILRHSKNYFSVPTNSKVAKC